jgi:hypothetical protein
VAQQLNFMILCLQRCHHSRDETQDHDAGHDADDDRYDDDARKDDESLLGC